MDALKLKLLSSMEKVFLTKEPCLTLDPQDLYCLKNELFSFQIGYCAETAASEPYLLGHIEIRSALCARLRVRRVVPVPVAHPVGWKHDDNYISTEPGLYPDLLTDIVNDRIMLLNRQWSSVWIDLEPGDADAPGSYVVEVVFSKRVRKGSDLTCQNIPLNTLSFTITLLDATLPKLDIKHTEWFHCDCLADYYGVPVFSDAHFEIIEKFIHTYVKYQMNMILTPLFTPPLDTEIGGERTTTQLVDVYVHEGKYHFGFEKFRRFVALCQKEGIEYFEMSHLYTQWGARYAVKVMAMVEGRYERIFGWENSATSTAYKQFLRCFLPALIAEIDRLGLRERVFFHLSDEPGLQDYDHYVQAKAQIADIIDGFPIIDALSDYAFYQKGAVKNPISSSDHIATFIQHQVTDLWVYYCTGQWVGVSNRFIAMHAYNHRILGTQLYRYAIAGFLHWGFNFYNAVYSLEPINPYLENAANHAFVSGDPFIVYPGCHGNPLDSIRLMTLNAAMQDLRSYKCLEAMTSRDFVIDLIDEGLSRTICFDDYPHDPGYLINLRRKIYQEIAQRISPYINK